MPVASDHHWTVDDVWALPGDPSHRYEAVDGVLLVTPTPSRLHQRAVRSLLISLHGFATRLGVGEVLPAPFDVVMAEDTVVQPDLLVLPPVPGAQHDAGPRERPLPLLAVEILSPSTARHDRLVKRPRFQRAGVECWIVDLESRLVERWLPGVDHPEICATSLGWQPPGASAVAVVDLDAFFADVLGDAL